VLLPIFDHVRAEVTDTTTFTSERRRQQEDAWLYETCTHCLQVCGDASRGRVKGDGCSAHADLCIRLLVPALLPSLLFLCILLWSGVDFL
jgi:hypothetical protein